MKTMTAGRSGIPSIDECHALMARYAMLPNIVEHSRQVMRVSLVILENLENAAAMNRNLVIAAALLHDITKTRSLSTKERHDTSGGELLRKLGFPAIAEIVEQHVILSNFDCQGSPEEREVVYYADKRVMHDRIVTVEERIHDLLQRYGTTEEVRRRIQQNGRMVLAVENKISRFMTRDIHQVTREIGPL